MLLLQHELKQGAPIPLDAVSSYSIKHQALEAYSCSSCIASRLKQLMLKKQAFFSVMYQCFRDRTLVTQVPFANLNMREQEQPTSVA